MNDQKWSHIVAKTWTDDKFKQRLIADPAAVLQENGYAVPAGMTIRLFESQNPT